MKSLIQKIFRLFLAVSLSLFLDDCSNDHPGSQNQAPKDSSSTLLSDTLTVSSKAPMTLTYEQRQGKFFYEKYCSVCHGVEGRGDGFNAFNLDPKPRDFTDKKYLSALTDVQIAATVSGGGRAVNKSALMPSWGGRLTKNEQMYVVAYVRTFAINNNAPE